MRARLIAVTSAALLPALGILGYNELVSRHAKADEIALEAQKASRQASSELERIIDGTDNLLVAVSTIPAISNHDFAQCNQALASIVDQITSVSTIYLVRKDGTLICDSRGSNQKLDFSDREFFQTALETRKPTLGEYSKDWLSDEPILPRSLPVANKNHDLIGVLITGIRLSWLGERIRNRGLLPGSSLTVADRNGVIIARDPFSDQFVGTRIPDQFQKLVTAAAPGTIEVTSQDGTVRILGFQPITTPPEGLYVSAGISKDEAFAGVNRATTVAVMLIAAGGTVAFLAALLVGDLFIRKPIRRIVRTVDDWRFGVLDARTHMSAADGEIETVGASLDQLLDELAARLLARQKAEQRQQLLTSELHHRVKNTLSIVGAIAQQSFKGAPDKTYVNAFSNRLSALGGAYDIVLSQESDAADLRETIERVLLPFQPPRGARCRLTGPPILLPSQAVISLTLVIHELATNASKYGALSSDEGAIHVDWQIKEQNRRVRITWTEWGGPKVTKPTHEGFGSKLLSRAFQAEFCARIEQRFLAAGLVCEIEFNDQLFATEPMSELAEGRRAPI
jgi:two-component sensor histidine kinase